MVVTDKSVDEVLSMIIQMKVLFTFLWYSLLCTFEPPKGIIKLFFSCLFSCASDSTVTYYDAPRGIRRFSFDTFQFTGEYGNFVYLHCNLVVCNASKPTSRCSISCLNLEYPRRKRDAGKEEGVARAGLTEGPFILRRESNTAARDDYKEEGTDTP